MTEKFNFPNLWKESYRKTKVMIVLRSTENPVQTPWYTAYVEVPEWFTWADDYSVDAKRLWDLNLPDPFSYLSHGVIYDYAGTKFRIDERTQFVGWSYSGNPETELSKALNDAHDIIDKFKDMNFETSSLSESGFSTI